MNAVEIEEALSGLAAQPFDAGEFPFAFLSGKSARRYVPARFALPAPAPAPVEGGESKDWAAYAPSTAWFDAIPAEVIHRGERAVYIPSQDRIELPEREASFFAEAYFFTRSHESVQGFESQRESYGKLAVTVPLRLKPYIDHDHDFDTSN